MSTTIDDVLDALPLGGKLNLLCNMLDDLVQGKDETLAALRREAEAIGASPVIVGGVAVIKHGYERTTKDRDVLLTNDDAERLAEHLMNHPDWERLEIRQYAFLYKPTGIPVDFLVSGDLMQLDRPYYFPRPNAADLNYQVEGLFVVGLHDLLWMKLVAGRMRDLADAMELVKRHLNAIDPEKVLFRLQKEDDDLRVMFLEIIRKAPLELANEARLGQIPPDRRRRKSTEN